MKTETVSHTPGPWHVHKSNGASRTAIMAQDIRLVAVMPDTCGPDFNTLHYANAQLIASAPELLAHLRHVLTLSEDWAAEDPRNAIKKLRGIATLARAAIAKAEGPHAMNAQIAVR